MKAMSVRYIDERTFEKVKKAYPNDWLLCLEVYEISYLHFGKDNAFTNEVFEYLNTKADLIPENGKLIMDGLKLIRTQL